MLCRVRGSRGAAGRGGVGAPSIRASAFVGWQGGVCVWGRVDVPQAPSFPPPLLEGLAQASEDILVVLWCGELAGLDSLEMERIGQHGFPCSLRHPPPRWPESTVLRQPPAGPADQALEGGLCTGPLPQLQQLRLGPALLPQSMGGSKALGRGAGLGVRARGGVLGTDGGGRPGGVFVLL